MEQVEDGIDKAWEEDETFVKVEGIGGSGWGVQDSFSFATLNWVSSPPCPLNVAW